MTVLRIYYNLTFNQGSINIDVRDLGQDGEEGVTTLSRVITELPYWLNQLQEQAPGETILCFRRTINESVVQLWTTTADIATMIIYLDNLPASAAEKLRVPVPVTTILLSLWQLTAANLIENGFPVPIDTLTVSVPKLANGTFALDYTVQKGTFLIEGTVTGVEDPEDNTRWLATAEGFSVAPNEIDAWLNFEPNP